MSDRQLLLAISRLSTARQAARARGDLGAELTLMGHLNFYLEEKLIRDEQILAGRRPPFAA